MADRAQSGVTAAKLSEAIRLRTVSRLDASRVEKSEFLRWEGFLREHFPLIHSRCEITRISEIAYVYRLPGTRGELSAAAYYAHFDVVPADEAASRWSHPPFSGEIADGFVWGRGAIDDKGLLVSLWEALEELLADGFVPERSIYLLLGGDEEIGGTNGAAAIAAYLAGRGVRLASLLDEGAFVVEGLVPGASAPVALIGTAEKGYANVRLSVEGKGGHSSMPPARTAVGLLGGALSRIERSPFPLRITPTTAAFFRALARATRFPVSVVLRHPKLFALPLKVVFSRPAETRAMLRTTLAPTVLRGSDAENVLADRAEAVVNVRLLQGDTVEGCVSQLEQKVADRRVRVDLLPGSDWSEPTTATTPDSWAYRRTRAAIEETLPDAVAVPFLVVGATDSRHFEGLSNASLRFVPFRMTAELITTMHNIDERISLENLELATRLYRRLIALLATE